jgi:hypothetical protein
MVPSANQRRESNMNCTALLPCVARRVAIATALLVLLGAAGCATRRHGIMSSARTDVPSTSDSSINPGQSRCEEFSCEP